MKKIIVLILLLFLCVINAQINDFKNTNFVVADNTAKLYKGENLKNLPLLSYKLTSKLTTDVEKFRAIYSWVCNNIKNDYSVFLKINQKREKYKNDSIGFLKWSKGYKKVVFKRLLKSKKTMCTGYAYLVKELTLLANIDCKIIDGYGRTSSSNIDRLGNPNHSWNAVKLNNKWYLCDATWSSGYTDEDFTFIKDYNDGYFLTDPVLFSKNHLPIYKKWLLGAKANKDTFISKPIVYGESFKYKIIPLIPEKINFKLKKGEIRTFEFKTLKNNNFHNISLIRYSNDREIPIEITQLKNENNKISFECIFKRKGYHDIHLKVNNDIITSYSALVE